MVVVLCFRLCWIQKAQIVKLKFHFINSLYFLNSCKDLSYTQVIKAKTFSRFRETKLYIEENSATWDDTKVSLQNDGSGDYIKTWTYSFTKPTDSQIASYETAGNTAETLSGVLNKRKTEYLSWQEQLDKLYHDINDGKLDKTGSWYTHIKAVKDANSKG